MSFSEIDTISGIFSDIRRLFNQHDMLCVEMSLLRVVGATNDEDGRRGMGDMRDDADDLRDDQARRRTEYREA